MKIPTIEEQEEFIKKMKKIEKTGDKQAIKEALEKEFSDKHDKEKQK